MTGTSILKGEDPRLLSEERLAEIRKSLKGQPGIEELFTHIAALDDRVTVVSQYYEEFLIPEMERESWRTKVGRKEQTEGRKP